MKQRVKLAQALVHDPRLLLLTSRRTGSTQQDGMDARPGQADRHRVRDRGRRRQSLLGEIERVCDLVAIDAGRLIQSAPLTTFTATTGTLAVDVEEGAPALADALTAAGLHAVADGRTVLIELVDDRPWDLVRDTVADLDLPLVRMEQRRRGLEELFR
jgi:ABC-2 type transport system ATP-binding protein